MDEIRSQITYLYHVNLNYHMNTNKQSGILPTCFNRLVQEICTVHDLNVTYCITMDRGFFLPSIDTCATCFIVNTL